MVRPEEIDADSVEACRSEFLEDIEPELWHRKARIVELAGEYVDALALDVKGATVPFYEVGFAYDLLVKHCFF